MDDFDYSVEISDRDWQCFFQECEECNLLPPSLAGVDDSGMSDLDDTASMLAKRGQKRDPTAGSSEADGPTDGPPDSTSPPVGHYLSKLGGSGMESVLSGSEEDLHLQCVNMFFERLRNVPEAERPDEPSRARAGKNREELQRSDGRQANSSSTLPENSPPARDKAAVGKETTKPVDTVCNKNAMETVNPDVGVSPEPAVGDCAMNTNRLAFTETELLIRGETKVKAQCCDPTTLCTDKVAHVCTQLVGLAPDAAGQSKTAPQQPSPSASVKRKRRKKRRLSIEPVESGLGCERQVLGGQRPDDSEEEQRPRRAAAGLCLTGVSVEEAEASYRSDQVEELSGQNKYCGLPRSVAASVAGKFDSPGGTGNGERHDARAESLQRHHKLNHPKADCGGCSTAEVKSITLRVSPRADSNSPDVEDKPSVAKSVLAAEGGYSGRYEHTLCQREAEQQQQLEPDTDQYSSTPGKTGVCLPGVCEAGGMGSDAHNTKLLRFKPITSLLPEDASCEAAGALAEGRLSATQAECPAEPKRLTGPSAVTPLSSCCSLGTVVSLPDETIDLSTGFCPSISQNGSEGEKRPVLLEKDAAGPGSPASLASAESNGDAVPGAGDAFTPLGAAPNAKRPLFTMSSFWTEMEKLTINDILGLRLSDKAPHGSFPPVQEHEELDSFATCHSMEESVPDAERPGFASVTAPGLRPVSWDSETAPVSVAADIYPANMTLTPVISPPVFAGNEETGLRMISKNVSVHNLHALESEPSSPAPTRQTSPSSRKGGLDKVQRVTGATGPGKADSSSPSSMTGSYTASVVDMFRHLFGGKEPAPSQPAPDHVATLCADGKTLPETYDHFFCDFDTESFFCPLVAAADAKDELVPIFSYSRSANRNLHFPEAYDYFFSSSSSDDSSVESDEDEASGPVRVVSRFTQRTGSSPVSVDVYEHFFTDRDLGQNFFWSDGLSFRKFNLTGFTRPKPCLVPTGQSATSPLGSVCPSDILGNRNVAFPDPLHCRLVDGISKQLRQQPFTYDDLQTAVSDPRLDASFLPLRQSDMCLVCIAFASWVLKTANPQAGDAWKAVVLANVSALSAIRYLRKYVNVEASASEKKPKTDSS